MIIKVADRLRETSEYYFSVKLQEVKKLTSEGKDIINIAIGNPDMPPHPSVIDELYKAAQNESYHGYQPYRGIPELREAIADWYQKAYEVKLDPETEILPLMGSKEGITHISFAFLNKGDKVLVPELGYLAYPSAAKMAEAVILEYPMLEEQQWQPDFDALEKMDLTGVKIMWVNYPNMPTGMPADVSVFEKLVAFAKKHKILVCHDNPYSHVLNKRKPISLLSIPGADEVCLELNSLSKSHNMAGWRVGWIAGQKEYLDAIIKIKSNIDSGMFKPMQLAAAKALLLDENFHDKRNEEYKARCSMMHQILQKLGCTFDLNHEGMFIWAKINEKTSSSAALTDALLYNKGVFVSPGFIFGKKGERYIRVSLSTKYTQLAEVNRRLEGFDFTAI